MYHYINKEEIFVDEIKTEMDWPNIRLQFNFYLDSKNEGKPGTLTQINRSVPITKLDNFVDLQREVDNCVYTLFKKMMRQSKFNFYMNVWYIPIKLGN